jgi:tripartite-type tricarboxylate transporter receptor subunit TctC
MKNIVAAALLFAAQVAWAQGLPGQYPARPVHMVVAFAPEHSAGSIARAMQPRLVELLGQSLIIDNVPGRDGANAAEFVAKAASDGYVLLFAAGHTVVVNRIYGKLAVNPLQDLIPVTLLGKVQGSLLVRRAIQANDFSQLVGYAETNPRMLRFGLPQGLTASWVAMLELMQLGSMKMLCREYEDAFDAANALAKEQIDLMVGFGAPASHAMKSGRVKTIDYPPPGIALWLGLFVPAGTPREVVNRIHQAAVQTVRSQDVADKLMSMHLTPAADESVETFSVFLKQETQRWTDVVRKAEIQ